MKPDWIFPLRSKSEIATSWRLSLEARPTPKVTENQGFQKQVNRDMKKP